MGEGGGTRPSLSPVPERLPDKYELYELCVQSPKHAVPLLRAIHGREPTTLGEDFAGTGALSRAWCRMVPGGRAIAVDMDEAVLARCRDEWAREGGAAEALVTITGNVVPPAAAAHPAGPIDAARNADVIYTGNFSIGEIHDRAALVRYLAHTRARLDPARAGGGRGGVFVCDTYGGETAFMTGDVEREHESGEAIGGVEGGAKIVYTWEQRQADPLTGRVVNALHFRLEDTRGDTLAELPDAFVYHWRLWSVPELRDAMLEAGFARTEIYAQLPEAVDDAGLAYAEPIDDPAELDDSFNVYVVGRT